MGESANRSLMRQIGVESRGVEGDFLGLPASKSEMTSRLFVVLGVDSISSSIVDWRERVKDRECLLTFRSSKMQEKRFC